jgi:hypothetical protein
MMLEVDDIQHHWVAVVYHHSWRSLLFLAWHKSFAISVGTRMNCPAERKSRWTEVANA